MLTFMQTLASVISTGKVKVKALISYYDGWFFEFEIIDEEGVVHIGARLMPDRMRFTDTSDLMDELWCTPHLVYK
jgi:hypothetical protein